MTWSPCLVRAGDRGGRPVLRLGLPKHYGDREPGCQRHHEQDNSYSGGSLSGRPPQKRRPNR